ncbi:MAG: translation initiation factor IF-2 [Bacteroidales bacterium]|nr:translation initiation factor IF-2 [Bacteroidales bacterium]
MAEENKGIRLKKAATELNVGVSTLVEFLAKKGHQVESNPNTRLTAEQYDIVATAFQAERAVKEQADKIEITPSGNNVVVEANTEERKDETEEVIIKNYNSSIVETKGTPKPVESAVTPDAPQVPEPKPEVPAEDVQQPAAEVAETPTEPETPAKPQPQAEEAPVAVEEAPAAEKPETPQEEISAVEEEPAFDPIKVGELRIINKIDLDAINTKTRPDKKKKSKSDKASKAEKAAKNPASETKAAKSTQTTKESKPAATKQKSAPAPAPAATTPAPAAPAPAKEPEFIETQYQKLEGPKLVGMVDLSQFEKPKSGSGEKRKRKRIKNKGVKVNDVTGQPENASAPHTNTNNTKNSSKSKKAETPATGTDAKSEKTEKKKKKEKKVAKVEIDDSEIEKQIRDTLARLSPMGKSKTSKHNREKRQKVHQRIEEEQLNEMESQKTLQVTEFVTANELATMMNVPVTQVISTCMSVGIFVSINQRLDAETIKLIADEFGFEINFASADVIDELNKIEEDDRPEDLVTRNPIVTVMGHVDHGKTSLLDYIRKTNVIAGEAGGITQHIGAYEVTTADGRKITFLDTPGHEAFTAMRARGAKVTDIAIIVIAADDKIMPQTVEAINHAQAAGVPIVFAINKIDKPGADPDRIKTELANMNLLVEEWGGKYQSQDISAKKGINVEELLEKVILQADIMELKGNPNKRAKGTVLESSLDKGRGYVAKLLVENGTIRKGDPIVAGAISGRVRAMYNERNQEVMSAGPSQPVLLLGLTGACQAGDTFNVTENEKEAKDIASKRTQLQREQGLRTQTHLTLDEIGRRIALGNFKELNVIVKGDVDGSVEALSDSLLKLSTDEVQVNVIHKAVGQITETDVMLAESSDAIIIGFQVRPSVGARKMAETDHIDIRLYSIIYDAINELKDAIEGMLSPETQEKIVANLEIRETFKISKVGTIAGCMCLDGKITRNHNVRIIRDGIVVYTGKLASLKRFKDDVKEVVSGQDCGLNIEGFNDIKVGDIVEAYEIIEIKRKL